MKKRQYFFSFPPTKEGKGFKKKNRPTEQTFIDLLASVAFHLEESSRGTIDLRGLFKIATLAEIKSRGNSYEAANDIPNDKDGTVENSFLTHKAVMPYHLPLFYPYSHPIDDSGEVARNGIGILRRDMTFREDFLFKLRLDTLQSVTNVDVDNDCVVISRDSEPLNKNKSLKIPVKKFFQEIGVGDFYTAEFRPSAFVFKTGNSNSAIFSVFKNGQRIIINSLNEVNILTDNGTQLEPPKLIDGELHLKVVQMLQEETGITVEYILDNVIKSSAYTHITKDASMDVYEILTDRTAISLGGTNPNEVEVRFSLVKNGSSISIQKSNIDLSDNTLPNDITYTLESANANNSEWKLKLTKTTGGTDISGNSYAINIKISSAGNYSANKMLSVLDTSSNPIVRMEFAPTIVSVNTNDGNVNPAYKAVLKMYSDDVYVALDPNDVVISPRSSYATGPLEQADDGMAVLVPILRSADGAIITATYTPNSNISAALQVIWSEIITAPTEFLISPSNITYQTDSLGDSKGGKYYTELYLKDSLGNYKDLTVNDVILGNPAGITITKTELTSPKGFKYLELEVTEWTTSQTSILIQITINSQLYPDTPSALLGLSKTQDGAKGDAFNIDEQGSGHPTGQGFIDEEPGFTYLDTDDSKVYFKTGAAGTDEWSAGTPFGKGDPGEKGDPGLPPAHNWNGTKLSFQNPDGTPGVETELLGQKGDKGDVTIPYKVEVDPATGHQVLYYKDEQNNDVVLATTNSVIGPPGASIKGEPGEDGIPINWLGNFAVAPSSPSINDAYRNTTDKKSYIWTQVGVWDIFNEDGQDPVLTPASVATRNDLSSLRFVPEDIGRMIYIKDEIRYATIHLVTASGEGGFKYGEVLSSS